MKELSALMQQPKRFAKKLSRVFHMDRLRRRGLPGPSCYEEQHSLIQPVRADMFGGDDCAGFIRGLINRPSVIAQYGFAVPNEDAIELLARCPRPLVEMGAGLGYWAALTRERFGVPVDCYDLDVPPTVVPHAQQSEASVFRGYRFEREPFCPVLPGTPESLRRRAYGTLLMIWPDYQSPMAMDSLRRFSGSVVVYVGEWHGCTANEEFHDALQREWVQLFLVPLWQWAGVNDHMMVFVRKSTMNTL